MKDDEIRKLVRKNYGNVASQSSCGCNCGPSCCDTGETAESVSLGIGYSEEDISIVPEGANLGLGCGNPVAIASLREGETVLDLGSGAGFDCFLSAQRVGKTGHVIGVDMTPQMLEKARKNAEDSGYSNVEFRLGEIEHLPVANASVDVIISNCVINLSPDKSQVFQEAFQVLRPGGRIMVSDIVLTGTLPEAIKNSVQSYTGCVSGALQKEDYIDKIAGSGFHDITIMGETAFPIDFIISDPHIKDILADLMSDEMELKKLKQSIKSIKISAKKPE